MDSAIHGICGIRLDGERLDGPALYHVVCATDAVRMRNHAGTHRRGGVAVINNKWVVGIAIAIMFAFGPSIAHWIRYH